MSAESASGEEGISTQLEVLADERGPGYLAYLSQQQHVRLTAPVRALLASARADGVVPILVTEATAVLSPLLVAAMRISGGCWAVRTNSGVYDGLTGRQVNAFSDFLGPHQGAEHPDYPQVPEPQQHALMVEVIAHQRAEDDTLIGPLAEALLISLGGAAPDRWGVAEPLTREIDHAGMSAAIRAQMPEAEPHLLAAPDGSYATVSVGRSKHGLIERVRAGIGVGARGEVPHADLAAGVSEVFRELTDRAQVMVAFASSAPVVDLARGMAQRPGPRAPELPLAILIGPRATHDLQPDLTALRTRFDVSTCGRARTPSLLLRTPGEDPWRTLHEFTTTFGDRVATALGLDQDFLQRMGVSPEPH